MDYSIKSNAWASKLFWKEPEYILNIGHGPDAKCKQKKSSLPLIENKTKIQDVWKPFDFEKNTHLRAASKLELFFS